MEDNLLRLDQTIANLLSYVDQTVGLDQTLIVLSADHGGPEAPGYLKSIGIQAEYVDPDQWNKEPGIEALTERFGKGEDLIQKFSNPFLYLDPEVISASGASAEEVQTAIAEQLIKLDGVALAIPRFVIEKGELPDNPITRSIINNHHPKRSGDIYIVFEPHRFINNMDGLKVAVTHGSPWTYDTFVPVIFAGNGLTSKNIYRRIETVDVATTMAAFLNMKPPSGATGNILREVLE